MEFTKYPMERKSDDGEVTIAVVGAGIRGRQYARLAEASGLGRVVAVAEPDPDRRSSFAEAYGLAPSSVFSGWEELGSARRLADVAVVATQDRLHADPAVTLAGLGYHLLLEKPMAPTEDEARRITAAIEGAGVIGAVCHVLRYTRYSRTLKELVDSGRLGQLASVQHLEPVGWWHQAHSFVRGNWRRAAESGPMLLTKSCHDLDWLAYLVGATPRSVASFGSLAHFHRGSRPAGAADRCLDCSVEPTCPYSAVRLYLSCLDDDDRAVWPLSAVTEDRSPESVLRALRDGPYGRCVYDCDNDVVDHQVVAMQYATGLTATFTMTGFTPMQRRQTRLFGSHGCIDGDGRLLRVTDFRTGHTETIDTGSLDGDGDAAAGHDGGDAGLVEAFLAAVIEGEPGRLSSDMATSLASHRVAWAAERARVTGSVVTL